MCFAAAFLVEMGGDLADHHQEDVAATTSSAKTKNQIQLTRAGRKEAEREAHPPSQRGAASTPRTRIQQQKSRAGQHVEGGATVHPRLPTPEYTATSGSMGASRSDGNRGGERRGVSSARR